MCLDNVLHKKGPFMLRYVIVLFSDNLYSRIEIYVLTYMYCKSFYALQLCTSSFLEREGPLSP